MIVIEIIHSTIEQVKEFDKEIVIVTEIEDLFHSFQLQISQKTTLSTKPGSVHWHLKREKQSGVLEVTYWIPKNRLWLEIHENRRKPWNEEVILVLANQFVSIFGGEAVIRENGI